MKQCIFAIGLTVLTAVPRTSHAQQYQVLEERLFDKNEEINEHFQSVSSMEPAARNILLGGSLRLNSLTSREIGFCLVQFSQALAIESSTKSAFELARVATKHGKRVAEVHQNLKDGTTELGLISFQKLSVEDEYLILDKAYELGEVPELAFNRFQKMVNHNNWMKKISGAQQAKIFSLISNSETIVLKDFSEHAQENEAFAKLPPRDQAAIYISYLKAPSNYRNADNLEVQTQNFFLMNKILRSAFPDSHLLKAENTAKVLEMAQSLGLENNQDYMNFIEIFATTYQYMPKLIDTSLLISSAAYGSADKKLFLESALNYLTIIFQKPEILPEEIVTDLQPAILYNVLTSIATPAVQIRERMKFEVLQSVNGSVALGLFQVIANTLHEMRHTIVGEEKIELDFTLAKSGIHVEFSNSNPEFEKKLREELTSVNNKLFQTEVEKLNVIGHDKLSFELDFKDRKTAKGVEKIATVREYLTGQTSVIQFPPRRVRR